VDLVQARGVGSREQASGRAEVLRRARMAMGGPVQAGDLENELAGVRRCYGGEVGDGGRSRARCGRSGGLFSHGGSRSMRSARTI
jgi:hypothetical protein